MLAFEGRRVENLLRASYSRRWRNNLAKPGLVCGSGLSTARVKILGNYISESCECERVDGEATGINPS